MYEKLRRLIEAAQTEAKAARDIAEAADAAERSLTDDERTKFDAHMAKGRELAEDIKTVRADLQILADAKALAEEIGNPAAADEAAEVLEISGAGAFKLAARPNLGRTVVESPEFKALMAPFGGHVSEKARIHSDPIRMKSLLTGASDTSGGAFVVADQSGIVEMLGRRDLRIRDLCSVRRTGSDAVEYVVQTSHTNAAAFTAEATTAAGADVNEAGDALELPSGSGVKPEGAWAFARRSATVKTLAEWTPATKRSLADVAALEGLINDELAKDLAEKEEDQIVSGDGSGENLDGITHVSGTQSQSFSTDIFISVRKAITKARTVGRVRPNAVALAPADVEKVDIARDTTNQYIGAGPFQMGPRTLWGLPIVETEALSAGTGIVGDFSKAVIWDREDATVTMTDSHADFFIRNLVAILGEQREAFAVTRPSAFVITATA